MNKTRPLISRQLKLSGLVTVPFVVCIGLGGGWFGLNWTSSVWKPPLSEASVAISLQADAQSASAEEIPTATPVADNLESGGEPSTHDRPKQRQSYTRLGATVAAKDPREALRILSTFTDKSARVRFVRGMAISLAQGNSSVALDIIKDMDEGDRETALLALMDRWTADDPISPVRQAELIHLYGMEAGLGMELLDADQPDIELATLWANRLDEGSDKANLLAQIAGKVMPGDPTAALALGKDLTGNNYVLFLQQTLRDWAHINPQAAMDWAAQVPDAAMREAIQSDIAAGWSSMDDEQSAINALAAMPPGTARTEFVTAMAERHGRQNVSDALVWANQLNDPADRVLAIDTITALPGPVTGIGASLNLENGMPLVSWLVAGSPAALSGQIHEGDRIMSVAQADGTFVEVHGMSLDAVVNLIRGVAGSTVQLQISSPQPSGFGPSHTVSLSRQLLKANL